MSPEEAKKFVNDHMDEIRALGEVPNLNDVNNCIDLLRAEKFYVVMDGTNNVIKDVLFNLKGELVPLCHGVVRR